MVLEATHAFTPMALKLMCVALLCASMSKVLMGIKLWLLSERKKESKSKQEIDEALELFAHIWK